MYSLFVLIPAFILYASWCSFWNRVRGGLLSPLPGGRIEGSIATGLGAGIIALLLGKPLMLVAALTVTAALGTFIWAVFNWSFDEQTGLWDTEKYPAWVRWIGKKLYPVDETVSNRRRGVVTKGLRGAYASLPMFIGFSLLLSPWAMLAWPIFFLQGVVYNFFYELYPHGIDPINYGEWAWGGTGIPAAIIWALMA